jgi:hypothetical protein
MRKSLPLLAVCVVAVSTLGFAPLPERRSFRATFTKAAADATKGYGLFAYETTKPGWKAEVSDGRLRLRGDHDAGDQRLFVTAQNAIGKAKWPDHFDATIMLGGTDNKNDDWNVGVSIGAVKVLFHPNYPGGAFRAETIDAREKFIANEDMGFTPAAGVMHQLLIKVRRDDQTCRFEVELADGSGGGIYRKTFQFGSKHLGGFDRIGLDRSGRRGGDALFESVSITLGN